MGGGAKAKRVFVAELARRVDRTPETIKRWVAEGVLTCARDERNRRVFDEGHVARCRELARLSVAAQIQNRKLSELVEELPEQLGLLALQAS